MQDLNKTIVSIFVEWNQELIPKSNNITVARKPEQNLWREDDEVMLISCRCWRKTHAIRSGLKTQSTCQLGGIWSTEVEGKKIIVALHQPDPLKLACSSDLLPH